jgi:hypothetical protein
MHPDTTRWIRQLTGTLAAIWALVGIGLSVFVLVSPRTGPHLPVRTSIIAGMPVVHAMSAAAARLGVEEGDQLLSVDGVPALESLWRPKLANGVVAEYRLRKPDGAILSVPLFPVSADEVEKPSDVLLHLGLLLVSSLYLAVALGVWWSRQASPESWALLLYCSTMSVLISSAIRVDIIPWAPTRVLATLPFLGATTFHLFTTYPIEPRWVAKRRRIRLVPYAIAGVILLGIVGQSILSIPPAWIATSAFIFGIGASLVSLGILAASRRQAQQAGIGDRADLMLVAGIVSLLPALLALLGEWLVPSALPWYVTLLWVGFFPIAVAYGMVRKQLFEFRLAARSSAAYGAATLAITGVFAFMITFADELVARYGVHVRSVQVVLLFLAILAFNPVRERMQRLVDNFFDRDRSRYRLAVREISEAMVSMLSMSEIGDRILVALTDTMGVSRAMVLLFDDRDRVLRVSAWRGDWEQSEIDLEIPLRPPDLEAPLDAPRGPLSRRLRRRSRSGPPRELLGHLRLARDRAARPDPVRRRSARRDRGWPQALGRAPRRRRSPAAADARQPELDRDREREGLRRDREAERVPRSARRGADPRAARDPDAAHAEREAEEPRSARRRCRP